MQLNEALKISGSIAILLIILIVGWELYERRKKKSKKAKPEHWENIADNGVTAACLKETLENLKMYKAFLASRMPPHMPEATEVIKQVGYQIRLIRNLLKFMYRHNPAIEITDKHWADWMMVGHLMAKRDMANYKYPNPEKEKELDQEIDELIKQGHLPEHFRHMPNTGTTGGPNTFQVNNPDDPRDQPYHGQLG